MRFALRRKTERQGTGPTGPPPSTGRAGMRTCLAAGPFRPPAHSRTARRTAHDGRVVMQRTHGAGSPGSPNPAQGPQRSLVAGWSAALLGVWLTATAADEPATYRIENLAIPESLTGRAGDPARGERIARDPDKATCLICHAIPIEGEPDPGDIGPPLHGVASRYTAGELRLRLVDPKRLNPETVMPSYYARGGHHRVAPEYRGRSIYSASEIEDVIAFLLTLTTD